MRAFFDAVEVFFDHLAAVRWAPLGIALALHLLKLVFRAVAWRTILSAAYPEQRPRFRSVLGAYLAGVGINSIAPARGGDLVKLYLIKHRIDGASYATLAPTLVVETIFDFFVAGALMVWAAAIGVLPAREVYARRPSVEWKWFVEHYRVTGAILVVLALLGVIAFVWARRRVREFRAHVAQGFAILKDRPRFFGGLIVLLFSGEAPRTLILSLSVGMNIALVVANLLIGFLALALMARTLSWKRLRHRQQAEEQTV